MLTFTVKSAVGETQTITAETDTMLMEALNSAMLVEATCGGAASCGTCHVYFDSKNLAGEQTEDESYMLEALEEYVEIREGSRLSCQVKLTSAHDGMTIEIAPKA